MAHSCRTTTRLQPSKVNPKQPEDITFGRSKSDVDGCREHRIICVTRKMRMDRRTAFQLYIIDAHF